MKPNPRPRSHTAKKNRRMELRQRQLRQRITLFIIGGIALAALGVSAFILARNAPRSLGEKVPVMASAAHVPDGADPGPYNSDPPTSGKHYAEDLSAGFYTEADAAGLSGYPAGYLVHSLEHGYVIFWYNCKVLDESACQALTTQLKQIIEEEKNYKVIAFPWDTIAEPVVATTWGQMLRFNKFDPAQAREFIKAYRNKAPEPFAD